MAARKEPQPISKAEAKRIWTLQQQNKPLSETDKELLKKAAIWQMWVSHGILPKEGSELSVANTQRSDSSHKSTVVS